MPPKPTPTSIRPSASAGTKKDYVRFSDKLTEGLDKITETIEDNKTTIDTVQELGIELSHTISSLATTALKYIRIVDKFLDEIVPIISNIPLVPKKTIDFLNDVRKIADKVIAACESSQSIAGDVESGLTTGDVNKLKSRSADLKKVVASLDAIIPD